MLAVVLAVVLVHVLLCSQHSIGRSFFLGDGRSPVLTRREIQHLMNRVVPRSSAQTSMCSARAAYGNIVTTYNITFFGKVRVSSVTLAPTANPGYCTSTNFRLELSKKVKFSRPRYHRLNNCVEKHNQLRKFRMCQATTMPLELTFPIFVSGHEITKVCTSTKLKFFF